MRSPSQVQTPSALTQVQTPSALTIRIATPADGPRIDRLAALDSSLPPAAPVLLAELDGEVWVAVSLLDLGTVADPFRPTAPVRTIALARARQLLDRPPRPRRRLREAGRQALRPQSAT